MMFEVISQEDTHIIKYDQDHLYVLDMIQNTLDVNGKHIDVSFSSGEASRTRLHP